MTDLPAVIYLKPHKPDAPINDFIADDADSNSDLPMRKTESQKSTMSKQTMKRKATEENYDILKNLLTEFEDDITNKLSSIEEKLDVLSNNWDLLDDKAEQISTLIDRHVKSVRYTVSPQNGSCEESAGLSIPITSGVTYLTLNTEADFPNGSWLGFEKNPEQRVRCKITSTDMFHVNTTCKTAEKMALSLLDLLFDRETQACSNISGSGKHKKKQLNPLYIYGIKCHLMYHFNITEQDWNKIKQNIDSKCRSAFQRRARGLPLSSRPHQMESEMKVKETNVSMDHFTVPITTDSSLSHFSTDSDLISFQVYDATLGSNMLEGAIGDAQLIYTDGNFEIFDATPKQVAQLPQTDQVQLSSGDQIPASPIKHDTYQGSHENSKDST